ncbi:MAG: hypothetical protein M5U22_20800 [Thermoleophilia bacterium]|nr:hypothetical protein [Thermoleophilia bacterium]
MDEDPYPIKFLFFRKYNLLGIPGSRAEQIEALNKVFVTVADIQASESVWMADLVLPEVNYLEGRSFNQREYFSLWPQIAVQLPAPKVSGEAKGFRWILPELAKAFGDWKNAAGYTLQDYFRMNPGVSFDAAAPVLDSLGFDDHLLKKLGADLGMRPLSRAVGAIWPVCRKVSIQSRRRPFPCRSIRSRTRRPTGPRARRSPSTRPYSKTSAPLLCLRGSPRPDNPTAATICSS